MAIARRSPCCWCPTRCSARSSVSSSTGGAAGRCCSSPTPARAAGASGRRAGLARTRKALFFVLGTLVIIALNRFFLAGLSASQPHVADERPAGHRELLRHDRRQRNVRRRARASPARSSTGLGTELPPVRHRRRQLRRLVRAVRAAHVGVVFGSTSWGPTTPNAGTIPSSARSRRPPAAWSPVCAI